MNQPKQISTPWAEEGLKNNIPSRRDVGLSQESATYQEGFPSITMTPISVGGKPPSGRDMNGVLYELSANIAFMNKGKHYKFNQDFCNEINGYPKGAVLINDTETALYISTVDQNKTNFNTQNSESWKVVADIKFSESLEKKADKHSPAFTGTPIAPTPEQSVNSEQIATTAFVKAAIAALVGSAPETLDTLAEIATALGNDGDIKQVLLGEINKKSVVSVIKGVVSNGATLPLPSGYNENECNWTISISEDVALERIDNANTGYTKTECYVDSNRRVVARVYSKAGANIDSATGKKYDNSRANYLVIGVK